jgi:hypothetical protein
MDSGAMLTSIIGASVATISLAVGKDSKVSEFRQQWIDALREDVAKLCSVSVALFHANIKYRLQDRITFDVKTGATDDLVAEANNLTYRIKLRLDSRKARSTELIDAMERLAALSSHAARPFSDVEEAVKVLMVRTECVLDEAWVHVRRGEKRFRWTYRAALLTLVLSIGTLAVHWYQNGHKF